MVANQRSILLNDYNAAMARAEKAEAEVERLTKYARHLPSCKGTTFEDGSTRPCDCGFE